MMTRMISTAVLALVVGLGAPALAQENQSTAGTEATVDSQIPQPVADALAQYGYEVDPTMLTPEQRQRFEEIGAAGFGDDETEARRQIDEVLVMDAGTATYVSEELRALMEEPEYPELRRNARAVLGEAGYDGAIADSLSVEQLAQLWFLQDSEAYQDDPAMRNSRIQTILE